MWYVWMTVAFWVIGLCVARLYSADGEAFQFITPATMAVLFTSCAIGLSIDAERHERLDVERQERQRHEKLMLEGLNRVISGIRQLGGRR